MVLLLIPLVNPLVPLVNPLLPLALLSMMPVQTPIPTPPLIPSARCLGPKGHSGLRGWLLMDILLPSARFLGPRSLMLLLVALLADRGRRGPGARTLAQATQADWMRRERLVEKDSDDG